MMIGSVLMERRKYMKNKWKVLLLIAILAAVLLLSGCAGYYKTDNWIIQVW